MSKNLTLSVVVNTKNAADTLELALASVVEYADQVVVVDMKSSDATLEIARAAQADIFTFSEAVSYVEPARNFALSKATGDWVLVLDADEEVSPGLAEFLQKLRRGELDEGVACYRVPRQNFIFGDWVEHTGWWPDYQVRLFRNGSVEWSDEIHAVPKIQGEVADLPADTKHAVIHHNYVSVQSYLSRLDRYTTIAAAGMVMDGERTIAPLSTSGVVHAFANEFLRRACSQAGYLDGVRGMGLSLLQGMYEVAVVMKVWEMNAYQEAEKNDPEAALEALSDFKQALAYWVADAQVSRTRGLSRVYWQLRRRLRI